MQRYVTWTLSAGCLVGTLLLFLFFPDSLRSWWGTTFQGGIVRGLPHLPVLLLAIATFWGSHARQDKVTLLALLLIGTHVLLSFPFPDGLNSEALRQGLAVFLPWAFPLLMIWPEASLKSPWGWGRLGATLCIGVGALLWASNHDLYSFCAVHLATIPGGVKSLSPLLALITLWVLSATEGPGMGLSWTGSLISLGLASLQGETLWPTSVANAPWPVFLSFSTLFLLGGLYGVTWRRAYLDELTGIPARRAFEESLPRLGRKYAIAMVDVDHFKGFNDRYGHQIGDQVLRFIATRLKRLPFGQAFRYGGEEFAIIMPGRRVHQSLSMLEDLRKSIETSNFTIRGENRPVEKPKHKDRPSGGTEQVKITVSIGIAGRSPLHPSTDDVVRAADEALYHAKETGRNRVEHNGRRKGQEGVAKRMNCVVQYSGP
ncbi:MAG: diguanylate cyclase [Proteobacteria bacterium]|nr:diguanylate cyclase [Pseudomonadota bacterium]NIS72396.1 diguanylate cyclase [Pseudomonadota bacterium]